MQLNLYWQILFFFSVFLLHFEEDQTLFSLSEKYKIDNEWNLLHKGWNSIIYLTVRFFNED
jgi:hypothetical protein